jgi:hypothetical protein
MIPEVFLGLFFVFVFSFGNSEVWSQSITLARQVLYHLSHLSALLCFIFQAASQVLTWDQPQTVILLPLASHIAGTTGVFYCAWVFLLQWDHPNILPELDSNQFSRFLPPE